VTRIIAGYAGSLALEVPRAGTRPTSDRVREAIFSALEARLELHGARVLDLYAGSGALGLEAASRGAAEVLLVERDAKAAAIARRNAALVRRAARESRPRIEVVSQSVGAWLAAAGGEWDLVLADPPYDLGEDELEGVLEGIEGVLAPDGEVVVERSTRSPAPSLPPGLLLDRTKRYGETAVHWLVRS